MGLWWQRPLACYLNKGARLGVWLRYAIHATTWNPNRRHLLADLQSSSCARGASTPTCGVPSLYMWTLWRRYCGCCSADQLRRSWRLLLQTHEEETIVIDYLLYTDTRLRWITASTLLPLLNMSSGNDDQWPLYLYCGCCCADQLRRSWRLLLQTH
jgi:hypothetical protein